MLLSSCLVQAGTALSDPTEVSDLEGIASVTWDFGNITQYETSNTTLAPGSASLSIHTDTWMQSTAGDFQNGSSQNLEISGAGSVSLSKTGFIELLDNGNFTIPDDMGEPDTISNWTRDYKGDFDIWEAWQRRVNSGGAGDGVYCWKNHVMEWDSGVGYNASFWLNQSFVMPSVPLSVNISALHNFQNNSYVMDPGSTSQITLTRQSTNTTYIAYDTGYSNRSYAGYKTLWSNNASIFSEGGNYTLSLFTHVDSRDNVSDTCFPNGFDTYWDNASIGYTAHLPEGAYVSPVLDTGSYAMWNNISWSEDLPFGTGIEMFVRTGNSSVPTDSIWSNWSAPLTAEQGSTIDRPWGRYVQYRADLTTQHTNVTPKLHDVRITYSKFSYVGTVETGDFLPDEIEHWGYFSFDAQTNGQSASFKYSIDSGLTWLSLTQDTDLRNVPITVNGMRIMATLATTDTVITPDLRSMSIQYTSHFPSMTLDSFWESEGASPGETARLHIHFNNSAASRSTTAWLNVYLDENLEYVANNSMSITTFDSFIYDSNPGIRKYVFSDIIMGNNQLWIDAKVMAGTRDGDVLQTTVTLEYLGPLGNRVESLLEKAPLRVDGPVLTADLVALNTTGDVGDRIFYDIHVNNTGKGLAPIAWLNGTLDDRFAGENISLALENISGGSSSVIPFNVTLKDNVVQGSTIPMKVSLSYADTTGFMDFTESEQIAVSALLRSGFSIELLTQVEAVDSSDMVVLIVFFNNSGYGNAEAINFEFTIPEGLEFVSSSEEYLLSEGTCYWEIENVGRGAHSFTFTLRAMVMGQSLFRTPDFFISMQVSDPVDGVLLQVASNNLFIDVNRIYTFWEKICWPWSGIAAAAIITVTSFGLWYIFKPIPPSINDAFVLYKDGRLISHRRSKNKPKSELDGDLVGAMLTAVQQFISDSLSEGGEGKVKKLEFGDMELYLERGTNINIALVYSGSMNRKLQAQVQELANKIETEYPNLKEWDGRMSGFGDIHSQVDVIVDSWQTARQD